MFSMVSSFIWYSSQVRSSLASSGSPAKSIHTEQSHCNFTCAWWSAGTIVVRVEGSWRPFVCRGRSDRRSTKQDLNEYPFFPVCLPIDRETSTFGNSYRISTRTCVYYSICFVVSNWIQAEF